MGNARMGGDGDAAAAMTEGEVVDGEKADGEKAQCEMAEGEGGGRGASPSKGPGSDDWPPAPEAVPCTRAELIAGHGIGAERTWRRVRRGVYVPPGEDVTPQVRALAEVRARRGAVLSGASAARACGHPWVADRVPEVVLVRESHSSGGVILSGRRPSRPALACPLQVDGGEVAVLVADPVDVTIDCVAALPDDEAIAFLDGAIRVWGIDRALREWASGGRPGAQRMRELLEWSDWRAESRPESLLRTKLRRAGAGRWVPQFMVTVGGGKRWVDLGDPDYRIAVEFHGEGHWRDAEARRRDALRVNELREVGWCVVEVTILDVFRDFDALLRRIGEHRRRIDAERDGDLAWRRGKSIDAMRMRVNRWLR